MKRAKASKPGQPTIEVELTQADLDALEASRAIGNNKAKSNALKARVRELKDDGVVFRGKLLPTDAQTFSYVVALALLISNDNTVTGTIRHGDGFLEIGSTNINQVMGAVVTHLDAVTQAEREVESSLAALNYSTDVINALNARVAR